MAVKGRSSIVSFFLLALFVAGDARADTPDNAAAGKKALLKTLIPTPRPASLPPGGPAATGG